MNSGLKHLAPAMGTARAACSGELFPHLSSFDALRQDGRLHQLKRQAAASWHTYLDHWE